MWLRTVKSAEEVALIRNGARIADLGGHAVRAAIAEGVPEYEIALAGTQAIVRAIAATYPDVELMDSWVWFQSGLNTDGAHNPVTSRRLRRGDLLSLNCFPMIAGYYTALEGRYSSVRRPRNSYASGRSTATSTAAVSKSCVPASAAARSRPS